MKSLVIDKLFDSLQDLDRAIGSARKTFERKDEPPKEVLNRLESYQSMLDKQRTLLIALCNFANAGNWTEVSRHIRLINGLSQMIRDDAQEMLCGLDKPIPTFAPREVVIS